jgi:hypothetical protein
MPFTGRYDWSRRASICPRLRVVEVPWAVVEVPLAVVEVRADFDGVHPVTRRPPRATTAATTQSVRKPGRRPRRFSCSGSGDTGLAAPIRAATWRWGTCLLKLSSTRFSVERTCVVRKSYAGCRRDASKRPHLPRRRLRRQATWRLRFSGREADKFPYSSVFHLRMPWLTISVRVNHLHWLILALRPGRHTPPARALPSFACFVRCWSEHPGDASTKKQP